MNLGHWVGLDNFSQISTWIDLLIAHIIVFGLNRPGGVELERARLKNSLPAKDTENFGPIFGPPSPFLCHTPVEDVQSAATTWRRKTRKTMPVVASFERDLVSES